MPNLHPTELLGWEHENDLDTVQSLSGADEYDKECALINNEKLIPLKSKKTKALPPQSVTPHAKRIMETETPFSVYNPENAMSSRKLYSPLGFKKNDLQSKVVLQKKNEFTQHKKDSKTDKLDDEESIDSVRNERMDALDQTPLSIISNNNNTMH